MEGIQNSKNHPLQLSTSTESVNSYLTHQNNQKTNLSQYKYQDLPAPLQTRSFSQDSRNTLNDSPSYLPLPLYNSRLNPGHKVINKRHSMIQPRLGALDDRALAREIEKLKLDFPRLSFETDTDSDLQSLADNSFNLDDLTDVSSIATSEVRKSTDSLTPSEFELVSSESKAERSGGHYLSSKIERSESLPVPAPTITLSPKPRSSPLVTSPPISSFSSSKPPKIKPIPPNTLQDPKDYLNYLETTFSRNELGSLLSKKDDFHSQVLGTFMDTLDFKDQSIDMALRSLLNVLHLPKEAQQIDRIITVFSQKYYDVNKDLFASPDLVYSLAFSLLLLHTDAHNKLVKNKMSKEAYIRQTRQLDKGSTIATEILEILYDNVTSVEFFLEDDNRSIMSTRSESSKSWIHKLNESNKSHLKKGSQALVHQVNAAVKVASVLGSFGSEKSPYTYRSSQNVFTDALLKNPFKIKVRGLQPHFEQSKQRPTSGFSVQCIDENADISELQCLKEGMLLRKSDLNEAGRRTHMRSWREFWVVLAGSQLVLFKEVSAMRLRSRRLGNGEPAPKPYSVTSVANGIAVLDREYTKHPFVFRFVTHDGRQYLFRAESKQEMTEWMTKINFTAAFKSTDVLPRGVSKPAFERWRKGLPHIQSFDFEDNDDEELRTKVIRAKVEQIDAGIAQVQSRIDSELQLLKQMGIMVTFSKSTRDRAKGAGDAIQTRLKKHYLDLQRQQCYKEILLQDLVLSGSVSPIPNPPLAN